MRSTPVVAALALLAVFGPAASPAQDVPADSRPPAPSRSAVVAATEDPDLETDTLEPDFTLINLPTTARLPRHESAFRVTHRFARGLGRGDLGDLAADAFGFDGGAQVGLEYRFGIASGTQLGFYRTSDRTIEFFFQRDLWQPDAHPVGLALLASVEGLDNFQDELAPRIGLVASRALGDRAMVYVAPAFIANANTGIGGGASDDRDHTVVLGLGSRLRLTEGLAVLGEVSPRLAGFAGGPDASAHATFAVEKRVGGHAFQINVSNDLATTPRQVARGQQGLDDWFIGFNISRKFY